MHCAPCLHASRPRLPSGKQCPSITTKATIFRSITPISGLRNNANQIQNSILAQQAKSDIDSALQGKGLQLVGEAQNPDVIILASGGMQQQTSYSAMGMRGFGGGMGTITPQQNVVGTLIVDVYGAKDKTLLWRGLAQNTLSNNGNKNSQMVSQRPSRRCSNNTPSPSLVSSS